MSGYSQYPSGGGTSGITKYANFAALPTGAADGDQGVTLDTDQIYVFNAGTSTWLPTGGPSVPLVVGTFNGAAPSPQGATLGSNSLFMQGATALQPGLVSSASQTFAGVKTFSTSPVVSTLGTAPVKTSAGSFVSGSISLTAEVAGSLPLSQTSGSISLTNQVSGSLPLSQTTGSVSLVNQVVGSLPLTQTSGSVSLTTQVQGILPQANLPPGIQIGSVSLTNQVSGVLPNANMSSVALGNAAQVTGSISLTTQVVGILPQANLPPGNVVGSVSLTNQVSGILPQGNLTLAPTFTQASIGSVTQTSSAGGAAYTMRWPGAQGALGTTNVNDGAGNLSWQSILVNPMNSSGDMIVGSGSGIVQRLSLGTVGQVLSVNSGSATQAWGTGLRGTTIGDNPATGFVGEFVSAGLSGSSIPGATSTLTMISQITLTPGDWDVQGVGAFQAGASTATSQLVFTVSLSSASFDLTGAGGITLFPLVVAPSGAIYLPTGERRISIGSTTSVYLLARLIYTVLGGATYISDTFFSARRVR